MKRMIDNIDSDWAQLNREMVLETAYSRLFPFERDLALHVGVVLPNNKIRIKCTTDAAVARWLETREHWTGAVNDALRLFMNYRINKTEEIQQISTDLLPNQDDPDIVHDINDSLDLFDDNGWIVDDNEGYTIITLDFDVIDWYQRNYGQRYEFQIAEVLRSFMESQTQA